MNDPEISCQYREEFLCKVLDAKGKTLSNDAKAFTKNFKP